VSSLEGTFPKEKEGTNPKKFFLCFWAELFFCCGRPYCTDPYSPYNFIQLYGFGTEIEAVLGTIFKVDFRILFVVSGPYGTVRTTDCWHENRGTEEVVQQYGFGTENEVEFGGTVLVL
jgi:hypothetical protein